MAVTTNASAVPRFPAFMDYRLAIQNPKFCFADAALKVGRAQLDKLGLPSTASGNFGCVFQLSLPSNTRKGIKCFTRYLGDRERRYRAISEYFARHPSKSVMNFEYRSNGMVVNGYSYPLLLMEWITGPTLDAYIDRTISKSNFADELQAVAHAFRAAVLELESGDAAHGDLQHGNLIVSDAGLRLVDLDGMYVPALQGFGAPEAGMSGYQHPKRKGGEMFGPSLDRFAALVIYLSLNALSARPELWNQCLGRSGQMSGFHDSDDKLIFDKDDFRNPSGSKLFAMLKAMKGTVGRLAEALETASLSPPDATPSLSSLLQTPTLPGYRITPKLSVTDLSGAEVAVVECPVQPSSSGATGAASFLLRNDSTMPLLVVPASKENWLRVLTPSSITIPPFQAREVRVEASLAASQLSWGWPNGVRKAEIVLTASSWLLRQHPLEMTVQVLVAQLPEVTLLVDPPVIERGQSATLSWTSRKAEQLSFSDGADRPLQGSVPVSPVTDSVYRLVAKGPGGTEVAEVTVKVTEPRPWWKKQKFAIATAACTVCLLIAVSLYYLRRSPVPPPHPARWPYLEAAVDSYRRGDCASAARALEQELTTSKYEPAKGYLAEMYVCGGRHSDAVNLILEQNEEEDDLFVNYGDNGSLDFPDWPPLLVDTDSVASQILRGGKFQQAQTECQQYFSVHSSDAVPGALENCGVAWEVSEDQSSKNSAEQYLQKAIESGGETIVISSQCDLALLLEKSRPGEALPLFQACVEESLPGNAIFRLHLGVLLLRQGDYEKAEKEIRTARNYSKEALEPDDLDQPGSYLLAFLREKAERLARGGDWNKATDTLKEERAIRGSGLYDWDRFLAFCALSAQRWQLAENIANNLSHVAPKEKPPSPLDYYWLAKARLRRQNNGGSQEAMRQALARSPDDPWLQQALHEVGGQP
jgi:tetratricopeptide (TPR) repeat protein